MRKHLTAVLFALCCLPAAAQLSGTGFYRFRNADRQAEYISLANDKFNYTTCISTACGGLRQALTDGGKARGLECAGRYLETDIHMVEDADCINVGSVVYAKKRNTIPSNRDYNLIAQGTSLLTLTTGTYPGSYKLEFNDRYVTIDAVEGTGDAPLYTAKIELKSSTSVILYGQPSLGIRYLVDDGGTLAINEENTLQSAWWYVEPVEYFNVRPEVEFGGKFYTTMYASFAFTLSDNVLAAYAVTGIGDDGRLATELVAASGETVPAGTPVLLECASGEAADCRLIPVGAPLFTAPDVSVTSDAPAASTATNYEGTNLLRGSYFSNEDGKMTFTTQGGSSSFNADNYVKPTDPQKYVLGITPSGHLGLVAAEGTAMPANKAWLEYDGEAELLLPFGEQAPVMAGDVNGDERLSIADVAAMVSIIVADANAADVPEQLNRQAADMNGDGRVDQTDIQALTGLLLGVSDVSE